jgi:hypothetical protein
MAQSKTVTKWLQATTVRVSRVHFLYIAAYLGATIVFDSWNLFPHVDIANRWTVAALFLVINTVCWYVARIKFSSNNVYVAIILLIVILDVIFAATNVYWERGLASKAVALFAVPIITAATLRSRSTVLAAASLSVAAYSLSAVRYFNLHYGESFRVELYGYVALYAASFFILALLLLIIIQPKEHF